MTLHQLFIDELKDLYSSESQLVKALPKMVKAAKSQELKDAFDHHLRETEKQLDRVKKILEITDEKVKGELCKGMQGIIAEGEEQIEKKTGDLGLVGAGERVEHYEIASYQSAIAMANQLGLDKVEKLLTESLREEENASRLLSQLSKPMLKELSKGATASAK
jgi:ferritin-like metal-binding protein YciE